MSSATIPVPPQGPCEIQPLLESAWDRGCALRGKAVVSITIRCQDGEEVTVTFGHHHHRPKKAAAETDLGAAALAVLRVAGKPLKGAEIARRQGTTYSGHFRGVLAQLVEDGELVNGEEGYAFPDV